MNTETNIDKNDPRLTSYALGECSPEDMRLIAGIVKDDPALQQEVAAIKATSANLMATLAQPDPSLNAEVRQGIKQASSLRIAWIPRVALAAAACAAVAFLVPSMLRVVQESPESESNRQQVALPEQKDAQKSAQTNHAVVDDLAVVPGSEHVNVRIQQPVTPKPQPVPQRSLPLTQPLPSVDGDTAVGLSAVPGMPVPRDAKLRRLQMEMHAPVVANAEAYGVLGANDFQRPAIPGGDASTFSIDVDSASYTNARRMLLREHRLPPKDAIRVEEFINYFDYNYAQPRGDQPFAVAAETTACPWNAKHRLVRVGIQGKDMAVDERPASNLVFLIDTSGSMHSSAKLPLLITSFEHLLAGLDERDNVAIVTYAGSAGVVLPSTSGANKETIRAALQNLRAGGSTNGGAGIQLAYKLAREQFIEGGTNRVILATDGDFNVGRTDAGGLVETVRAQSQGGIQLTVLGFGTGNLKDDRMETLSNDGDGVYHYVDSEREGRRIFGEGLAANLVTIARDVKIQVFFNPAKVAGWRLVGYQNRRLNREDFNNDAKDAGDIGAGHQVTALYEIIPAGTVVPGAHSDPNPFVAQPAGGNGTLQGDPKAPMLRLRLRHKVPGAAASELQEFDLDDSGRSWADASEDTRWAAAVAGLGMHLRNESVVQNWSWEAVYQTAHASLGAHDLERRNEFLHMIQQASALLGNHHGERVGPVNDRNDLRPLN